MNAVGFDAWREKYETLDTAGHAEMYSEAYKRDPGHASFSGRAVRVFLNQAGGTPEVAEIGGRNGSLAKVALEFTPAIKKWTNYEICPASYAGCIVTDPRYQGRLMGDFRWWKSERMEGDILIMAHIIEHLSDADAQSLIAAIPSNIRGVHVQAPIALRGPTRWTGFNGAHILSMGWMEMDEEFVKHGFRSTTAYDGASWFRR